MNFGNKGEKFAVFFLHMVNDDIIGEKTGYFIEIQLVFSNRMAKSPVFRTGSRWIRACSSVTIYPSETRIRSSSCVRGTRPARQHPPSPQLIDFRKIIDIDQDDYYLTLPKALLQLHNRNDKSVQDFTSAAVHAVFM